MTEDERIVRVADLAEDIVEEVSTPDQDWAQIAVWARELVKVAESAPAPRASSS